jgi:hypothetical protein
VSDVSGGLEVQPSGRDTPASGGVSLVLRRALALTAIAVAFSAACAFAFSPKIVYFGRALGRGLLGAERGFTPVPRPSDSANYDSEGGVPGTYCPIPARAGDKSLSTPTMPDTSKAPQMSSPAIAVDQSNDLLLPPPATKCLVPATAPSGRAIQP